MSAIELVSDDPWLQYLPELHRTLAAPEMPNGLPRSFVSLNLEKSCAWWETLRYLLRSLVAWKCLPAGLAWWYEAGKPPLGDPRLRMVLDRWSTRRELDYFAAHVWKTGGHSMMGGYGPEWTDTSYEPSPGWLRELHARAPLMENSPYDGGSNPLHLSHSDLLEDRQPISASTGFHDVASRRATLIVSGFDSWQRELRTFGASLPPLAERSWKVELFDRKVGFLGLFRQSRVTGHWFQGKHSIHMAGNPQSKGPP